MTGKTKGFLGKLQTYYRSNRKSIRVVLIALIALGAVRYGVLYAAAEPGICGNCHEVYPAFESWQQSIHSSIACNNCHTQPGILGSVRRVYLQFTSFADPNNPTRYSVTENEPRNDMCLQCHSLNREMTFDGGLNVPHEKHIQNGLTCTTCHTEVVHGTGGEKSRKPKMETCMKCHNGKRAPEGCGVCHITIPEPTNDYYYHPDQRRI